MSHHSLELVRADARLALGFVAGWAVMVVAMMLPTATPFLVAFQQRNSLRADVHWLSALLIAGYLISWICFGVLIYAGDWLLHQATHRSQVLAENVWVAGALIPIAAGIYQLTGLKHSFLESCRSSLGCAISLGEQGMSRALRSLLAGLRHGLRCVGCCWALMLLMFATGAGSLGWMAGLGVVMVAERWLPWGRRLAIPVGIVLLAWGSLLLLDIISSAAPIHHH